MPINPRAGRPYMRALQALKDRAPVQECWRQGPKCARILYADAPKGHPQSITLGHLIALEDGGDPLDPMNHAPECPACNYGDGARRTNAKKAAQRRGQALPQQPTSYRNPMWGPQ